MNKEVTFSTEDIQRLTKLPGEDIKQILISILYQIEDRDIQIDADDIDCYITACENVQHFMTQCGEMDAR